MSTHQITWAQWTVINETIVSERLRSKQLSEQLEALTKENEQLSQVLKDLSEELFKNERDLTKGYSK
jgi:cell division protein FtsB